MTRSGMPVEQQCDRLAALDVKPGMTVKDLYGRWLVVDGTHDWEPADLVMISYRDADGRYAGEADWPKSELVEVAPPETAPWRTPEEDR